jgi:hypothetical protein
MENWILHRARVMGTAIAKVCKRMDGLLVMMLVAWFARGCLVVR